MGSKPSCAAWVSCGESLVGGLVSRLGGYACCSTFPQHFTGQEYLVRGCLRTIPHRPSSSDRRYTGHPARHGWWCQSPATVPVAEASGRALGRDLVLSVGDWLFLLKSALRMALSLSKHSHAAKQVCTASLQIQTAPRAPSSASGVRSAEWEGSEGSEADLFFLSSSF